MKGKVVVVTGANTGIGKITALQIAKMGGHVIVACRSPERAAAAIDEIQTASANPNVELLQLDLADLASVRRAAEELLAKDLPLHVLINNAGVAGHQGQTKDGFEVAFGVNHLGHFLFTELLRKRIEESAPARIVNVASRAHYRPDGIDFAALREPTRSTTGLPEYQVSKLANVLHARSLAKQFRGKGVTTYSLHPGVVASDVWRRVPWPIRSLMKLFMVSNEEGAKTSVYCATADECAEETGLYYNESAAVEASKVALDDALADELWQRSVEWTQA